MKAYHNSIYPVFEADQVLSQKDLNNLVSHLEEQDRISRKNLTGIGIVCGLDVTYENESKTVKISCGTAVTSLGFEINFPESTFTHYHEIELPDQFLEPDITNEAFLAPIFKYSAAYKSIKNCNELLKSASDDELSIPIPADFFINHVIILLLEVSLIDQKNCDTTNCNDKGKRMEFNLRPLVIPINEETLVFLKEYNPIENFAKIIFPRYNVPVKDLSTAEDVLKGFQKIFLDANNIELLDERITIIFKAYQPILNKKTDFSALQNVKNLLQNTVNITKESVQVQYIWDWFFDLSDSYNEIVDFSTINPAICCVDEKLFPFHVVLGNDSDNSKNLKTPFFKTSYSSKKEETKIAELNLLFERIKHLLLNWKIEDNEIRITPSSYGNLSLSKKAIPFYYKDFLTLKNIWNPKLTSKNKQNIPLSYQSEKKGYTQLDYVQKPLLFDIEPFNFFRIEGHIGQNYTDVLEDLNLLKESQNLPFKITALNAVDFVGKEVAISNFKGRWDDLETDYDLARKRLYNITEFVINWITKNKIALNDQGIITESNLASFTLLLSQIKGLLTEDLMEFLPNSDSFQEIFKQLNLIFVFHRACILLGKTTINILTEDLIDRFDDINELFLEDPFQVIVDEAEFRWENTYKKMFFSNFVNTFSGLEHKAGVTKGGTFVVVYVDSSIFKTIKPPIKNIEILQSATTYKNLISKNFNETAKAEITESVKMRSFKRQIITIPKTVELEANKEQTERIKSSFLENAKYSIERKFPAETGRLLYKDLVDSMEFGFIRRPKTAKFEKMVIADFFLPYICCSEGNPIEIKFDPKVILSISMDQLKYCNNDKTEFEIKIKGKSGGVFSGSAKDAVKKIEDKFFLIPVKLTKSGTYDLVYTIDEESSNTLEIEVSEPKDIQIWTSEVSAESSSVFIFKNPNKADIHHYEFDFGDKSPIETTAEKVVIHQFAFTKAIKEFKVKITQLDEICRNTQEIIVTQKEPLTISMEPLQFCNDDRNQYEITIKGSLEGTFSGTGKAGIKKMNNKFFLEPSQFKNAGTFNLVYEAAGEKSNTLEFEISQLKNMENWNARSNPLAPNSFDFFNSNTADTHEYEFNFGDKTPVLKTSSKSVSHQFPFTATTTEFTVKITQLGEICKNSQEIKVTKEAPIIISLDILKYCITDSKQYEITIQGSLDGTFSGTGKEGIKKVGSKFFIVPSQFKKVGMFNLLYEVGAKKSNTLEFEISEPKTIENWKAEINPQIANTYIFTNLNRVDLSEYEFNFGDKSSILRTKEKSVSHKFPFSPKTPEFKVTILKNGGICQDSQEVIVRMRRGIIK